MESSLPAAAPPPTPAANPRRGHIGPGLDSPVDPLEPGLPGDLVRLFIVQQTEAIGAKPLIGVEFSMGAASFRFGWLIIWFPSAMIVRFVEFVSMINRGTYYLIFLVFGANF